MCSPCERTSARGSRPAPHRRSQRVDTPGVCAEAFHLPGWWGVMTALRSLLLAFVVVALGAAGLAARAAESGPAVGAVTAVKGTVFRESEGGKRAPIAAGAAVFKADVIVAEAAGKARIHLND